MQISNFKDDNIATKIILFHKRNYLPLQHKHLVKIIYAAGNVLKNAREFGSQREKI